MNRPERKPPSETPSNPSPQPAAFAGTIAIDGRLATIITRAIRRHLLEQSGQEVWHDVTSGDPGEGLR